MSLGAGCLGWWLSGCLLSKCWMSKCWLSKCWMSRCHMSRVSWDLDVRDLSVRNLSVRELNVREPHPLPPLRQNSVWTTLVLHGVFPNIEKGALLKTDLSLLISRWRAMILNVTGVFYTYPLCFILVSQVHDHVKYSLAGILHVGGIPFSNLGLCSQER